MSVSTLEEFRKLFWSARASLRASLPVPGSDDPAYEMAIAFAQQHSMSWATSLLHAVWLGFNNEFDNAGQVLQMLTVPLEFEGEQNFCLGWVELHLLHWDSAAEFIRLALESPHFSQPAKAWLNLGIAQDAKGLHQETIDSLQRALPLMDGDPEEGMVWGMLGSAHAALKSYHRAQECFEQALSLNLLSNRGDILRQMGEMYRARGDYKRAIEHFDESLQLVSGDSVARAWQGKACAHLDHKEFEMAVACFQRCVEACGDSVPSFSRCNLAFALFRAGKEHDAKQLLEMVLSSPEDSPGVHAHARRLLEQESPSKKRSRWTWFLKVFQSAKPR